MLLIALPTAVYTMFGGVQAVTWTDVKQMVLIVGGLLAAVVVLVLGAAGRRRRRARRCASPARPAACRRSTSRFDLTNQYTFWSGTIAALFLFCSVLRHRSEPGAALPDDASRWTRRARRC